MFKGCLSEYDYLHNLMPVTMSSDHTKHGNTVYYWIIQYLFKNKNKSGNTVFVKSSKWKTPHNWQITQFQDIT